MNSIPRERHPQYYFKDGTVHFLISEPASQTLYKLYPGLLALRSSVLESLLSLPQPMETQMDSPREGSCDENPIILHGIIRREFDHLLTFLFGGYAGEPHREDFLLSVLKLSAFFDISDGFQYAVAELNRSSLFDSSLKLQLGRQYRVDDWVEPAFQDLMSRPFSSISSDEACRMGVEYFYILANMKILVEEGRRAIAYTPPPFIPGPHCQTPSQCEMSWEDEWWNGMARQLLHPEDPCHGHEVLALLEDAEIPGVCTGCKEATVEKIKQSDALRLEETLGNIAVTDLMELQTDEHIRAPLRRLYSQVE